VIFSEKLSRNITFFRS